ncbi:MAG: hypothetical protein DCC65_09280 [Planctomycetota bacterium]|nr:MAG: hypothetical protein DCC65_09280 [Planctomycetota bacterium]
MNSDPATDTALEESRTAGCSGEAARRAGVRGRSVMFLALLLAAYGVGLVRQLDEPWIGLHDWNGAFYSQLARNLIRYPFRDHHAMPLVAVGDDAPPEERSIYATHPAGLVWVMAAAFRVFGEGESAARLAAVLGSLVALAAWVALVAESRGREPALLSGLLYAAMPMAVYFGRMSNHEAFCLCGMVVALYMVRRANSAADPRRVRPGFLAAGLAAMACTILIDWVGVLFAGLLCVHVFRAYRTGRAAGIGVIAVAAAAFAATGAVILHIVYGGLDGEWADLVAIFTSRSGAIERQATELFWLNTVDNLTLPGIALSAIGLACMLWRRASGRGRPSAAYATAALPGGSGVWVLVATGLIWLLLFRRQYQIHQYWLFYLGPPIALCASTAILFFRDLARRFGERVATGAVAITVLTLLLAGQRTVDSLFSQRSWKLDFVRYCEELRAATPRGERVVLERDPISRETFGGYVFRNIVPPQLAYYLDRPFVVRTAPEGAP